MDTINKKTKNAAPSCAATSSKASGVPAPQARSVAAWIDHKDPNLRLLSYVSENPDATRRAIASRKVSVDEHHRKVVRMLNTCHAAGVTTADITRGIKRSNDTAFLHSTAHRSGSFEAGRPDPAYVLKEHIDSYEPTSGESSRVPPPIPNRGLTRAQALSFAAPNYSSTNTHFPASGFSYTEVWRACTHDLLTGHGLPHHNLDMFRTFILGSFLEDGVDADNIERVLFHVVKGVTEVGCCIACCVALVVPQAAAVATVLTVCEHIEERADQMRLLRMQNDFYVPTAG